MIGKLICISFFGKVLQIIAKKHRLISAMATILFFLCENVVNDALIFFYCF